MCMDSTSVTKRCNNCTRTDQQHTNHMTLAAKCPYRRSIIDTKLKRTADKISTDQQKTNPDIARKAVRQVKTDNKTPKPTITQTDSTSLNITALILEAHIACINSDKDFDIGANFPDRDSKKIHNLYFDPPTTEHDDIYRLCPDTGNTFIGDDDIGQSKLNFSDYSASDAEPVGLIDMVGYYN